MPELSIAVYIVYHLFIISFQSLFAGIYSSAIYILISRIDKYKLVVPLIALLIALTETGLSYAYINLNPHLVIEIFGIAQPFLIGTLIASAIITPLLFFEKYWTKRQRITVIILASFIVLPLLFNVIYGTVMGRRSIASIGLSMIGYPEDFIMDGLIAILECKELLFFSTLAIYTHICVLSTILYLLFSLIRFRKRQESPSSFTMNQ